MSQPIVPQQRFDMTAYVDADLADPDHRRALLSHPEPERTMAALRDAQQARYLQVLLSEQDLLEGKGSVLDVEAQRFGARCYERSVNDIERAMVSNGKVPRNRNLPSHDVDSAQEYHDVALLSSNIALNARVSQRAGLGGHLSDWQDPVQTRFSDSEALMNSYHTSGKPVREKEADTLRTHLDRAAGRPMDHTVCAAPTYGENFARQSPADNPYYAMGRPARDAQQGSYGHSSVVLAQEPNLARNAMAQNAWQLEADEETYTQIGRTLTMRNYPNQRLIDRVKIGGEFMTSQPARTLHPQAQTGRGTLVGGAPPSNVLRDALARSTEQERQAAAAPYTPLPTNSVRAAGTMRAPLASPQKRAEVINAFTGRTPVNKPETLQITGRTPADLMMDAVDRAIGRGQQGVGQAGTSGWGSRSAAGPSTASRWGAPRPPADARSAEEDQRGPEL